jgi:hypothetical protein
MREESHSSRAQLKKGTPIPLHIHTEPLKDRLRTQESLSRTPSRRNLRPAARMCITCYISRKQRKVK